MKEVAFVRSLVHEESSQITLENVRNAAALLSAMDLSDALDGEEMGFHNVLFQIYDAMEHELNKHKETSRLHSIKTGPSE